MSWACWRISYQLLKGLSLELSSEHSRITSQHDKMKLERKIVKLRQAHNLNVGRVKFVDKKLFIHVSTASSWKLLLHQCENWHQWCSNWDYSRAGVRADIWKFSLSPRRKHEPKIIPSPSSLIRTPRVLVKSWLAQSGPSRKLKFPSPTCEPELAQINGNWKCRRSNHASLLHTHISFLPSRKISRHEQRQVRPEGIGRQNWWKWN